MVAQVHTKLNYGTNHGTVLNSTLPTAELESQDVPGVCEQKLGPQAEEGGWSEVE